MLFVKVWTRRFAFSVMSSQTGFVSNGLFVTSRWSVEPAGRSDGYRETKTFVTFASVLKARAAAILVTVRLKVMLRTAVPPLPSEAVIFRTWVPAISLIQTEDRSAVFWAPAVAV